MAMATAMAVAALTVAAAWAMVSTEAAEKALVAMEAVAVVVAAVAKAMAVVALTVATAWAVVSTEAAEKALVAMEMTQAER